MSADVSHQEAPDRRRWRALTVIQLAAFMVLLDVSIVNVAVPSIERELAMPSATAQWVVSGYALTPGLTLVPAAGIMTLALLMALAELARRRQRRDREAPIRARPEEHAYHV